MLTATTIKRLNALGELSKKGKRINGLFRLLENPALWMQAYANIAANRGATTQGSDGQSLDGFSQERVLNLIQALKEERYCFKPARRVYIPKANNNKQQRPLGIPSGDDKLIQEVVRILLEKIYEPVFRNSSHGFRPGKSCHTALSDIQPKWTGVTWIIDMDIQGYFNNINHAVLIELLKKKIDDDKFINLIKLMLAAGYIENWKYYRTYSGTPQGGIASPILANVYLHELDVFINTKRAEFNKGKCRGGNPEYRSISYQIERRRNQIEALKQQQDSADAIQAIKREILALDEERKAMPSTNPFDANYKRLFYCRYADDFIIGIIGAKQDALMIRDKVQNFIRENLHLEIAQEKSKVVHAQKGARFLGYDIKIHSGDKVVKSTRSHRHVRVKSVSKRIQLHIPQEKLQAFCHDNRYGNYATFNPLHRSRLCDLSDAEIVQTYNAEIRGLANYYGLAVNASRELSKLVGMWQGSLFKTLARKHRTTVNKIANQLRTPNGHVLTVRSKDKTHAIKIFSIKDMKRNPSISRQIDAPPNIWQFTYTRSELIQRLNARQCEYCGQTEGKFEVHHVRKLKDIKDGKEKWQVVMAARRRKTLILCMSCHHLLHAGKLPDWKNALQKQVESRMS